jgi:hypothetical protein
MLTGHLTCARCGSSMEARSRHHGRTRVYFYGCAAHHRRGRSVCDNNLTVPLLSVEDSVVQAVEARLLESRILAAAATEATARLTARHDEGRFVAVEQDLASVTDELSRLATAIASGGPLPSLLGAVSEREERREVLGGRATRTVVGCARKACGCIGGSTTGYDTCGITTGIAP